MAFHTCLDSLKSSKKRVGFSVAHLEQGQSRIQEGTWCLLLETGTAVATDVASLG